MHIVIQKLFICSQCDYKAKTKYSLKDHIIRKHALQKS